MQKDRLVYKGGYLTAANVVDKFNDLNAKIDSLERYAKCLDKRLTAVTKVACGGYNTHHKLDVNAAFERLLEYLNLEMDYVPPAEATVKFKNTL